MGIAIKSLIIVNFIFAIAFCFATLATYSMRTEYRQLYLSEKKVFQDSKSEWETTYQKIQQEYNDLTNKFDGVTRSKNSLEAALEKSVGDLKNQESINNQLKSEIEKQRETISNKENDIRNLTADKNELTLEKNKLTQIADIAKTNEQDAIAKTNRYITLNTEAKLQQEGLKKQLNASNQKVEEQTYLLDKVKSKLGKDISEFIVDGDLDKTPIKPIEAKVIATIPEQNLVMLSVGKADEVKVGYKFTVYRGGDYVGKVEVIELHPNMSAGRVLVELNNATGLKMERGDDAKTGL